MSLLQYPYSFTPGEREDARQLVSNFAALQAVLNGGLTEANLVPGIKFPDSKLASPPLGTPRLVAETGTAIGDVAAAGTFLAQDGGRAVSAGLMDFPGRAVLVACDLLPTSPPLVSKLRLSAHVTSYQGAPGSLSFGLAPVSAVSGTGYQLQLTLGAMIGSVTASVSAMSPGTVAFDGPEFAAPASGLHVFAITKAATAAFMASCRIALYQRFTES